MKIENAIILAAGRGSRMKELTADKPKCMVEINNKSIIQRTIEVFKYKNINNIIVITGYQSDKLKKHLKSIDESIKVIENPIWNETNSIFSMFLALKYLKNSIVIDSDIYINNVDCVLNDVEYSGYSALKDKKPSEWQLTLDKNANFIEKVQFDGNYERALPIIDISYWLEKDAKTIVSHIRDIVTHGKSEDAQKFWDEIPLIDFLHQLRLKRYDIEKTDAMEFDTPKEFEKVRKIVCLAD